MTKSFAIELDDSFATELARRAKFAHMTAEQFARRLLEAELTPDSFPNGVIGAGCKEIMGILERIPGVGNSSYSGYDFRHWVVSFEIDRSRPYSGKIMECLASILNTQVLEMWMTWPFVLKPESHFYEGSAGSLWWELHTIVPMTNPSDVAAYLLDELPSDFDSESYWMSL